MESDEEAPLSERAAVPHHDSLVYNCSSDALRRVQFQIGEIFISSAVAVVVVAR